MSFEKAHRRLLDRMIRVNQAGEYGAKRIYEGQLVHLKDTPYGAVIQDMAAGEEVHLQIFDEWCESREVSTTRLTPIWHHLGYALGVISARIGPEAAMAVTVAVEQVIESHYNQQLNTLRTIRPDYEKELQDVIETCCADEVHHKEIGFHHDAEKAPVYPLLTFFVRAATRMAIRCSERR